MENLFSLKNVTVEYKITNSFDTRIVNTVKALNGVDLDICKGEILGLVGESGCGKSTLGKAVLNLLNIDKGEILYKNDNIFEFKKDKLKEFRKKSQLIFQNPYESLNPRMKIFDILKEPLDIFKFGNKQEIFDKILSTIELVGLEKEALERYPYEFSGGQRQRIAIARALILDPEFIVADEPVSALDVSIQAQIMNLLLELKQKLNLTILFISHDLSVVKYLSDRIAVMYLGDIVEIGTNQEIFEGTKHPYTKLLINSIPTIDGSPQQINDEIINKTDENTECKFYPRCQFADDNCRQKIVKKEFSQTHFAKCNN